MYIKSLQNNNYFFQNKTKNNNTNNNLNHNKENIYNIKNKELQNKIHSLKKIEMSEGKSTCIVNEMLNDEIHFLNEISKQVEVVKNAFQDYTTNSITNEIESKSIVFKEKLVDSENSKSNEVTYTREGKELLLNCAIKTLSSQIHIYSAITRGMANYYKNNNSAVQGKIEEVLKNTNNDESLFDIGYKALGLEGLDNLDLTKPDDLMKKFDNSLELINKKRKRVEEAYSYLNNTYCNILNSNKNKFLINNQSRYINETI
ncbi:hypothetical protein [Tepidibacter sp. Z1-5]|uniref:hypothetical protein n=1 Tax=Tepidibacter sp. Z1-5 TaxID=3134138 RepID=UPI0030C2CCDC